MELTLDEALQKAVEAHKAGQVQEADQLYTAILQAQPKHPDANHNMGLLAVGVGKFQEALPYFKTALEANPSIGQFWLSYIDIFIKLDQIADARSVLNQAKSEGVKGEAFDQLEQSLNSPSEVSIDPPQDQLQPLINLYQQGQLQQALDNVNQLLGQFPNSSTLYNIQGATNAELGQFDAAIDSYKQAIQIKSDFAKAYNNMGAALKSMDNLKAAIDSYKKALEIEPDYFEAYFNMGNALKDKGDLEVAIDSYKQAIKIKPDYADAYYNMGNVLKDKGDLDAAINIYQQALKIKPDYAEVYYNMGNTLQDKDDLEVAIDSYKQALKINPDYAKAYNNMGTALKAKGDLDAAIESYKQALKIKPDYTEACANMLTLLTFYTTPKVVLGNDILKANQQIRNIDITCKNSDIIPDEKIINQFLEFSSFISGGSLEIRTELSQTYRRNSVDLNCKRHKSIFNEHDIIPEFCFGCYKVQVEPRSIIELIKLYVVFDQLQLKENNTRKCMVELRPEISGFYKGLIYCSGLKQANEIAEYLDTVVKQNIGLGLPAKVKRGCSEYSNAFPDYKQINNSGPQLMNYIEEWKVIEDDYDRKQPMKAKEKIIPSLSGLNLNDVLIIRKWVDYAKGIGDPTADLLNENTVYYQEVHDLAKARLDTHPFF